MDRNWTAVPLIGELAQLMRDYELSFLEIQQGETGITMKFPPQGATTASDVRSSIGGTAMLRHPSQRSPLVRVGDRVEAGQVIALIGHGPLYSIVRSPRDGTVARVYAEHGSSVNPNAPLLQLA